MSKKLGLSIHIVNFRFSDDTVRMCDAKKRYTLVKMPIYLTLAVFCNGIFPIANFLEWILNQGCHFLFIFFRLNTFHVQSNLNYAQKTFVCLNHFNVLKQIGWSTTDYLNTTCQLTLSCKIKKWNCMVFYFVWTF